LRTQQAGDTGPQALVQPRTQRCSREQALRTGILRRCLAEGFVEFGQVPRALQDFAGFGPGFLLGVGQDRAQRQAEADLAAMARGFRPDPADDFGNLGVGFAP
jgi:hypothetical protein